MSLKKEIANNTPLWWEIQNMSTEVVRELRRRNNTNNIGMFMPQPLRDVNFDFNNSWEKYKGPLTPWVRIFSNSTGKTINGMVPKSSYLKKNNQDYDYDGFILNGGSGFYDMYGYTPGKNFGDPGTNVSIIGYQANGKPHYIDNIYRSNLRYFAPGTKEFPQDNQSPSIIPAPAITNINIKQGKEYFTYADFSFKCFGLAQLEYLTPFFLTAGVNIFIEFGWNLFNQKSLLNLADLEECWEVIRYPQTVLERSIISNGNYGCISGIITKYNFKTEDGFVYDCTVSTTSRQALYAGMRTDNNAKIEINTNSPNEYKDFMDLRSFMKLYLPWINEVLIQPRSVAGPQNAANFYNYVLAKSKSIAGSVTSPTEVKNEKDTQANEEQTKQIVSITETLKKINNKSSLFYNGKSEDRVFIGRIKEVYKKSNKPSADSQAISYGNVGFNQKEQISFVDQFDFDSKEAGDKDVWLQLDFVFEVLNLFMSNLPTKQYKLDIKDVIVNAHPNIISCDKNVLIPNPIAPKVNIGRPSVGEQSKGGFLKGAAADMNANPFLKQKADIYGFPNDVIDEKIKNGTLDYKNLSDADSLYLAYEAARKTFRTFNQHRDNLDVIINYLHYHINDIPGTEHNAASIGNPIGSASFPFDKDRILTREGKDGKNQTVLYKKYYYGYLKHIYISKEKLIEISKSENTKNYKQYINAILNVVNESVDNFWKFEIQEGVDEEGNSVLSISDKNTINFELLKEIYAFSLGKTNNVVRNFNFDVNLSNEQAINVLFGGPNSNNLTEELRKGITTGKTTLNLIDNIPSLKFNDRLDQFQLKELLKEAGGTQQTLVPGTNSDLTEDNNEIADLQSYGEKTQKSGVLMMTVKNLKDANVLNTTKRDIYAVGGPAASRPIAVSTNTFESYDIYNDDDNPKNFKLLCLPSSLKNKLRQMLDDGDYKNNVAKYSGVADNLTVKMTLDGIFSILSLQCFAVNNLPKPYVPGNIVFQVLEVEHIIEAGSWKTVLTALIRCVGGSNINYITI